MIYSSGSIYLNRNGVFLRNLCQIKKNECKKIISKRHVPVFNELEYQKISNAELLSTLRNNPRHTKLSTLTTLEIVTMSGW